MNQYLVIYPAYFVTVFHYRAMLRRASPSVCPFVMLRYRDLIVWNSLE